MTVITLSTDFGTGDHEAGVLKGVIWQIAPNSQIVDLSHDIAPHQILEAALLLWRCSPFFPSGTIHVAVVDPGVGTSRRGIAARIGSAYFVGPDNGLASFLVDRAEDNRQSIRFVQLDQPGFWLKDISNVFHGRDIFAPIAAHLASGVPLDAVGTPISDPVRIEIPMPVQTSNGWRGQVIHIDHFGNLATNLRASHIEQSKEVIIQIKGEEIDGLVSTFGERPPGSLIAHLDSSGLLTVSVVNGSAAQVLRVNVGEIIEVMIES